MRDVANIVESLSPTGDVQHSLYRLTFVGGPFDGHATQSGGLPSQYIELRSVPVRRGTKSAAASTPLLARYKLTTMRLVMSWRSPIVQCRLEYCGTTPGNSSQTLPWWQRGLAKFWRWFEPRPSVSNAHISRRSSVHVQD